MRMKSLPRLVNVTGRQLLAFLEVCRLQSFSKAAERIHLSQSGMSMLVKELEEQVGARLFDRTSRAVTLTEAGLKLRPVAERVVAELRGAEGAIGEVQDAVRARLEVAATPMIAANLLPGVLGAFAMTHPHVRVQLSDVDVTTVRQKVLDGEADIGFGFFFKPSPGLLRQPLCKFRLMHVAPAARGQGGLVASHSWKSLAKPPLVSLHPDNPIQSLIESHLAAIGRAHEDRQCVNLIGTLIAMVEAGLGHAILPSFALTECLRHRVDIAMLVDPAVSIDLFSVSRRGSQATPAAVDFCAALKRAATGLAGRGAADASGLLKHPSTSSV